MKPTPSEAREHEASVRTLLAVEETARSLLGNALRDLGRSPRTAADEFGRRLREIYTGARRAARVQSTRRTVAELLAVRDEAARFGIRSPAFELPEIAKADDSDAEVSTLWSNALAKTFRNRAEAEDVRRAVTATRRRLELSAQAVTADAWADQRERVLDAAERVLDAAEREETAYDFLPAVGRLWDARLDACRDCRTLDGTLRPIGLDFPGGAVAGRKHWQCRCQSVLIFAPIYSGRRRRDAA
jgi:hypothetical protein